MNRQEKSLARTIKQGAVDAYASLAADIQNKDVLNYGAQVLMDEFRHLTVLNTVLGVPNY